MTTEALRRFGNGGLLSGIGSAIGNAGTLLSFAKYYPDVMAAITILGKFKDIEDPISTAAGLKARLLLVCDLGDLVAKETVTTVDDQLFAGARSAVGNDALVSFAASLWAQFKSMVPTATPAAFQAFLEQPHIAQSITEAVAENQFDLSSLMKIFDLLTQLIAIIRTFSAKPATPATPGTPATPPADHGGFETF